MSITDQSRLAATPSDIWAPLRGTLALVLASLVVGPATAVGLDRALIQAEHMDPVSLLNVGSVGAPVLSPDGNSMLFIRSVADWETDRSIDHIWLADVASGQARQMTSGAHGESSPTWAPDSREFVFLANRETGASHSLIGAGRVAEFSGVEGTYQLWMMPVDGGEARQLSNHATGVSSFAFAADVERILFLASDEKSEDEKALEKASGQSFYYPSNWKHTHLWSLDLASGQERRVTEGDWSIWSFSESNDGGQLALVRGPTPLMDNITEVDIWLFDVASGDMTRLTDNAGIAESSPQLSPDGRWVVYAADAMPRSIVGGNPPHPVGDEDWDYYYESNLFLIPASGGQARILGPEARGDVERFTWEDDTHLVVQVNLGVHSELFRYDLLPKDEGEVGASLQIELLTGTVDGPPSASIEGFDLVPGVGIGYRRATVDNPGELWFSATSAPFGERRVTDLNSGLRESWALPSVEVVQWDGEDGVQVEGILYRPIGYVPGQQYPLVVQVHGGPASASQLGFSSWGNYVPVLAGMGYMVMQPNYRGGVGYGDDFLRDMVGHYFNQASKDVYTGVDALIDRGLVDPERTAIMGWSAGGHMTNWVVTETDRFAAAASGAGASNWTSMYAQSDVRIYRTPWFLGTPWQEEPPLNAYIENSAAFNAHRAVTPTLILVGERDMRVPMAQSIEMYRALKYSGNNTQLVIFPGEPHGLQRLRHRLHKINVELEWFERHVRGQKYKYARPPEES